MKDRIAIALLSMLVCALAFAGTLYGVDTKVTAMTAITSFEDTDVLYVVRPGTGDRKITAANLKTDIRTGYGVVAGQVWTGVHDFGGATSIEIVNGASPTVDAAGEIAVDTTDDQIKYYGGAARAINYGKQIDFVVKDVDANTFFLLKARDPMTITSLDCIVTAGTSVVVTVNECDSAGANCASGGISVTADADGQADASFTDAAIDAGDWLQVVLSSESGTVTYVTCSMSYDDTAQ